MDLALVSCLYLPDPDPDAAPLAEALASAGITSEVIGWDDPNADWSRPRLSVLRSCWNYPTEVDAFRRWLDVSAGTTQILNPVEVVKWNLHKGYLLDLAEKGLSVTPTALVRQGERLDLRALAEARGWSEVVVKPAVSANSWRTFRVRPGDFDEGQRHLDDLLAERDALVQAFLPSVEDYGERSVIVVDGQVCHAVKKAPRFMADTDLAPHEPVPVADAEAALALRAVAAVDAPIFYARVDLAPGPDNAPMLMELELIEPSLFFSHGPATLDRYVAGIARRLAA